MIRPRHAVLAALTLCLFSSVALQAGGVVEGTVDLPKPRGSASSTQRYKGLAGTVGEKPPFVGVVYIEGAFPKPATNAVVNLAQKDYQFSAFVLPVRTGTRVFFPNKDKDYHNVFSYSKAKRFDLGRYRDDEEAPSILFEEPGEIKLYCEIHEHMRATILVLDSPYFTTTDAEGHFKLEDVPAGKHTLKIWLDRKTLEQEVEVTEGGTVKLQLGGK